MTVINGDLKSEKYQKGEFKKMIIVNQNKDEFVNFENIMCVNITDCQDDGFLISAGFIIGRDDNYRELGYYKTEERAKEVLKAITEIYQANKLIECCKDITTQNQITEKFLEAKMTPFKYEMPKE